MMKVIYGIIIMGVRYVIKNTIGTSSCRRMVVFWLVRSLGCFRCWISNAWSRNRSSTEAACVRECISLLWRCAINLVTRKLTILHELTLFMYLTNNILG